MKPQSVVMLVLGCVAAVALQVGIGAWFVKSTHARNVRHAAPPAFAFNFAAEDVADLAFAPAAPREEPVRIEEVREIRAAVEAPNNLAFSAPVVHENLAVFFIQGKETAPKSHVVSLETALAQGFATVHEGITIDNRGEAPIFIQAGDIIKGGSQDRTLPYDMVIPVGAQRVPLPAFCVEAGRSGPRGNEISTSFQSSSEQLPGARLNLAARQQRSQALVWQGVQQLQDELSRAVGDSVQAPISRTSLQLTLETPDVQRGIADCVAKLSEKAPEKNVIGVAFAINGRVQSAEIYGSAAMFAQMWPKLMRSNAIAALAERRGGAAGEAVDADAVRRFLEQAESGAQVQRIRGANTVVLRQESNQSLLFDAADASDENAILHRSYLAK